jgi:hypothetical protein
LRLIKTLQTLPNPILEIAFFFHLGSAGVKLIWFAFKTPKGTATIKA